MRIKEKVQNALGILCAALVFVGCFTAAFFLTSFLYRKSGINPPNYIVQLINSSLGLTLGLIIIKVAFIFDEHKSGLFDSVIRAQKKIAEGDFNIDLDTNTEGMGPYGELVESVNSMAYELSKLEKMRQEFISNVSHEIQSPLTSILGFSKALRNNHLSSESRIHYLNIIETESMRLSRLSDNLLKLAALENDTTRFEPKFYRLDKQIRTVVLSCEPQWLEKNIDFELFMEELEIKADEDMLRQVFINLISNSIKFTPVDGSISIYLKEQNGSIQFQIADTGIGIAQEDQEHIFERFYKADKSHNPSIKGSGLGLSIVKKIIDIHQGTILVESKMGEGTIFTLTFPHSF